MDEYDEAESARRYGVPNIIHEVGKTRDSVAEILVGQKHHAKLTHFWQKDEPNTFGKVRYLNELIRAVRKWEDADGGLSFEYPSMDLLADANLEYRAAYQRARAKDLVAITKVLERGEPPRRGILARLWGGR